MSNEIIWYHTESMYNEQRATREAIARDGTSILEVSVRSGVPPEVLERGMSPYFLTKWTRFTEEQIEDMGRP